MRMMQDCGAADLLIEGVPSCLPQVLHSLGFMTITFACFMFI